MRITFVAGAASVVAVSAASIMRPHQPPSTQSASVQQVWDREETYWRLVKAGDVARYVDLWESRFVGWPCYTAHPASKDSIGNWVRRIRDDHGDLRYDLQREGAADYGDLVVVYYRTPIINRYPDGRISGADTTWKFTHTWRRTNGIWLIAGGMCGLPVVGRF